MGGIQEAERLLQERFGHDSFREGQREAVEACLSGQDLLVVMPTGAGKSLCYQLPAMLQPGYVLVVSPLIALMKDQVDQLRSRGVAAATVHSGLSVDEKWAVAREIECGNLRILLVAPERFRLSRFLDFLRRYPPSRLVVDEAHCISQWGHDFRPDYRRLHEVVATLDGLPVTALTATATPDVRADIAAQLTLREPVEILTGFDRPNLSFEVCIAPSKAGKLELARELVESVEGTRLVYAASRRSVESFAAFLAEHDHTVDAYHAGLRDRDRTAIQDRFMAGATDVLVATNAFGMGVDKSDVRMVLHLDMPGSLEAYYQEAGRAGRDGKPSRCVLLQHGSDYVLQRFFLDGANPSPDLLARLFLLLKRHAERTGEEGMVTVRTDDLRTQLDARNDGAVATALRMLRTAGVLDMRGDDVILTGELPARLPLCADDLIEKRRRDEERLSRMWDYTRGRRECRFDRLRRYFVGSAGESCGNCDVCCGVEVERTAPSTVDLTRIREVLGLVSRLDFRFGPSRFVKILAGSRNTDIVDRGLDQLPGHGVLRGAGEPYIREFLQYLETEGLVELEAFRSRDGTRSGSLLGLTPAGRRCHSGELVPQLAPLPSPPAGAGAGAGAASRKRQRAGAAKAGAVRAGVGGGSGSAGAVDDAGDFNPELYDALRELRTKMASEKGRPAYTFFSNETLELLATHVPGSRAEFLTIKGLGEKRWDSFGQRIIDEIERHT